MSEFYNIVILILLFILGRNKVYQRAFQFDHSFKTFVHRRRQQQQTDMIKKTKFSDSGGSETWKFMKKCR